MTIVEEIQKLKQEKNAVILAHYYVRPEIQDIADYIGDSFYLSKVAVGLKEQTIVFCGVSFMGESAKVLNPEKTVLMPDMHADCAMAHMADAKTIQKMRDTYEDLAVVCYINSTAELKTHSDVCVTSANAVKIVKALPNKNIFFIPDKNLAHFIAEQVPEEPKAPKASTKMEIPEPLVKEQPVMKETVEKEPEDLSETMVLPDVKKEKRAKKKNEELQEDILTADTIDLSDTLNQIQKPKDADTKEVTDALVLDPVDAVVKEPFEAVPNSAVTLESNPEMLSLEPEEDKKEKETPSLDSLLQNINLGKKNKKKKGKDEDPFEFLGSVDDF